MMKTLKLIFFSPTNFIVLLIIFFLFLIDLIVNTLVLPFVFIIEYLEKAIKFMLNLLN